MSPELLEEDVEMAALEIFRSMGWDWADCFDEEMGDNSEMGRDNRGQQNYDSMKYFCEDEFPFLF